MGFGICQVIVVRNFNGAFRQYLNSVTSVPCIFVQVYLRQRDTWRFFAWTCWKLSRPSFSAFDFTRNVEFVFSWLFNDLVEFSLTSQHLPSYPSLSTLCLSLCLFSNPFLLWPSYILFLPPPFLPLPLSPSPLPLSLSFSRPVKCFWNWRRQFHHCGSFQTNDQKKNV